MITNVLAGIDLRPIRDPRKPKSGSPVTLIVGIIAKDAVVFGADSQTTCDLNKVLDTNKIHIVEFKDGKVMVAESGHVGNASNVLEDFRTYSKGAKMNAAPDLLEKALRKRWNELRSRDFDCSPEDLTQTILRDGLRCAFLLATFKESKPMIYWADLLNHRPADTPKHYASLGIGAEFGTHILSEQTAPDMSIDLASVLAIYAIERAIANVTVCGPPVRIGLLQRVPKGLWWPDGETPSYDTVGYQLTGQEVKELSNLVAAVTEASATHWREKVLKRLEKRSAKIMHKMLHPRHPTEDMVLLNPQDFEHLKKKLPPPS